MSTTAETMSVETWRTVRVALSVALGHGVIDQARYDKAMTEVMGTADKAKW